MAADVVKALQSIQSLPPSLHWFCPRDGLDDFDVFFPEDLEINGQTSEASAADVARKVEDAYTRRALVFASMQIFAFDGKDAAQYQDWLKDHLNVEMRQCDVCVREYYRGRKAFKEKLNDAYDEGEVVRFMQIIDNLNVTRIIEGLKSAISELESVSKEKRKAAMLSPAALYAIFETLTCRAMYADEQKLEAYFDPAFDLVQTNKMLRMSAYTPAMTQFLFGQGTHRTWWAERSWGKFKRDITASEFEWSVREPLLGAIARVQLHALDKDFLKQFWDGVRVIVQRLDREGITHSLRAMDGGGMEADISKLALNHLQVDSDGFKGLLATVTHILRISPNDFWESMGTISPNTWIEQFFCSPALERLIQEASTSTISDSPALEDLFGWIVPFLTSIKAVNQPSACRSLAKNLMDTFQASKYAPVIRTHCFKLGLRVLAETFRSLNNERSTTSSSAAAAEAFEVAEKYIERIAAYARKASALVEPSSEVIRQIISLDCKYITSTFDLLSTGKSAPKASIAYHASIWKHATKSLDAGNTILAKRLLLSSRSLTSLEKFTIKSPQTLSSAQKEFNTTLDALNGSIAGVVERLDNFSPSTMEQLFGDADTAVAIIMLLFASDERIRTATYDMMKTMSGQSTRSDALRQVLEKHFVDIMNALSTSFRQISWRKTFAPASSMLKVCGDGLDILCNPQDGLLRSMELSVLDGSVVERFWQTLWQCLTMIFSQTEPWSKLGHDKDLLQDFCRNAMEFAEKFFDQFGVISGALDAIAASVDSDEDAPISAGQKLVDLPRAATGAIVKWLKLRDEFLVTKSCGLVCKLLKRLREFDTELSEETLKFVMEIAYNQTKTTLSPQQKAELLRALEEHVGQGEEVQDIPTSTVSRTEKEQKRQVIDLEKWHANAKSSASAEKDLASVISSATPASERFRALQAAKPPVRQMPKSAAGLKLLDAAEFKRKRQQEMEEMKKKNAAAIAAQKKRLEGSGLKGLGVHGKDHTALPKGTGMMVSSDEESDEESETDLDRELFGRTNKAEKVAALNRGLTDDQARALKAQRQGPVKKQRLVRSARDMRARLAPDLSPLHKSLLSWEYFHEGNFPPGSSAHDYTGVIDSFRDVSDYQNTFTPLLVLEAWNGFLKAKEENMAKPYEIKVANRSIVDAFFEVSSTMSHPDAKEISEGDIVLLSRSRNPGSDKTEPHCLSRVFRMTRKKANVEVLYRVIPGSSLTSSLVPNGHIFGLKITSITPLEREYGALLGLQYYDLCDEIARAKPSPLLNYTDDKLNSFVHNYKVNKAQAKAIKCAIDNDGFTLIQGPPGSGKTKTIVAIVGALLSDTMHSGVALFGQPQATRAGILAKKMLVCAPSNAAVDELVMRFKEGIKAVSGEHRKLNIVRLGRSDAINANVLDVTLEELVNKKLNVSPANANGRAETQQVMEEHKAISEKLRDVRVRMDEAETKGGPSKELKEEFDMLRRKKAALGQKVDSAKDNEQMQSRQADINRRRAQQQVIDEAHVICATLSGSGHEMFQNLNIEFETVVIDEAAQCVELSALIPLKYGCAKCILVGDPQQLPPTVFSKDAARFKYEQSLFVRMQKNHPKDVHLLDTQYRMHPEISSFPSKAFYDSRLLDGKDMAALRSRAWHGTALLSPFRFFDVQGQHESAPRGHSLINKAEINIAMQLYNRLTTDFRDYDFKGKIGIITPYKSQLRELIDQFKRAFGPEIAAGIEFNTTDAFQGREAEIIIFSCVRASPAGGIGFLQDVRRMNVGLTRAKCSLWVLGNSQSLMKGEFWAKMVIDARDRDRYTEGDLQDLLRNPSQIIRRVDDGSVVEGLSKPAVRQPQPSKHNEDAHRAVKSANGTKAALAVKHEGNIKGDHGSIPQRQKDEHIEAKLSVATASSMANGVSSKHKPSPTASTASHRPPNSAASAKRKLVPGEQTSRKRPSSAIGSDASRQSSDADVEMTDVTDDPSLVRHQNGGHSTDSSAPSRTPTPKPAVPAAGAPPPRPNHPATSSKPPLPAPVAVLRKKKPVDPFIRKKPRPQ